MTRASEARVALVFATFGIVNELASAASTVVLGAAVVGARARVPRSRRAGHFNEAPTRSRALAPKPGSRGAAAVRGCTASPLRVGHSAWFDAACRNG